MKTFAIAIPCHNEAQNIQALLESVDSGWNDRCRPAKIAVFSSACRDRTEDIVRRFAATSRTPVELTTETVQGGKSHAVNQLMHMVGRVENIVLVSGDVIISTRGVMTLLKALENDRVGAAGGRPVPESRHCRMACRVSRVMWDVHAIMAVLAPKTTEVTAFRNLGFRLDETSLADEAEIESQIIQRGLAIAYCPDVTIRNSPPARLRDYMRQRTRVTLGHLALWKKRAYAVGSLSLSVRVRALCRYVARTDRQDQAAFWLMLALEACVLGIAAVQLLTCSTRTGVWQPIDSAKQPLRENIRASQRSRGA